MAFIIREQHEDFAYAGDDYGALIADFGLSRIQDEILSTKHRKTSNSMDTIEGTLRWMAPESMEGHPATRASDVYSFAITSWEARDV
jgi:serine/threonine protein kinase